MQRLAIPFNDPTFKKATIGFTLMKQISAPSPDRAGCIG